MSDRPPDNDGARPEEPDGVGGAAEPSSGLTGGGAPATTEGGKTRDARSRARGAKRSNQTQHAEGVDTVVVEDRGQWAVDIIVYFPDSVVRRRINVYRTKARAEISARLIKRGAEREIEGPLNG